jgi:asparagine synthase (glutamine-hydrolysing)
MVASGPDGLPVVLSFNGAIYNHHELRRELCAKGREFRSASDSEVLLNGYLEWGEAVVNRLVGMFAFAVWNESTGRLRAVHDRAELGHHPACGAGGVESGWAA